MAEVTVFQMWLMLLSMVLLFLSGLCWCFCCGTCVGRSMLRNTGLFKFTRGGSDNRQWQHISQDDEELWHLQTMQEEGDEEWYNR